MALADRVNRFVDSEKPWNLAKDPSENAQKKLLYVCSEALEAFRILSIFLKPILPALAKKVEMLLNVSSFTWQDINNTLQSEHRINNYEHLLTRVDPKQLDTLFESDKEIQKPSLIPSPSPDGRRVQFPSPSGIGVGVRESF